MKTNPEKNHKVTRLSVASELSELLKQHVIEFTLNQSPRTPIIIDGEKKVRERIEKLYNEWITNK